MWRNLVDQPVFVMTSDQDWAPAWAAEKFLSMLHTNKILCHFFRTNRCPVLDKAISDGEITQGWHPNFLAGSSHGCDVASVIDHMKQSFPDATTVRSHSFSESTHVWRDLARAGIVADSQLATLYQPGLEPLLHCTGIIRFPIFFEDDVFFEHESAALDLKPVIDRLFTPGLKILNFHATYVACNVPSRGFDDQIKTTVFAQNSQLSDCTWAGRGTMQVFEELVRHILNAGFCFTPFLELVQQTINIISRDREAFPKPYGTA